VFSITDNCPYPIQYRVLKEVDGISSETILLLWSMKEKYNCDSKFKSYFDTLPEKFNTG
jgi:histone-lysine N-methyltransferase SETD3